METEANFFAVMVLLLVAGIHIYICIHSYIYEKLFCLEQNLEQNLTTDQE